MQHVLPERKSNVKTITKQIRADRRARAETMQAAYDKLSLQEKLNKLPIEGAQKQRARLLKQAEGIKTK